jgi:DNA (cytosine-5)-methyltransferase 1
MLERDNKELPHVDLYACGFPCQSFSNMGKGLGTKDPRAKIIPKMLDSIENSRPKICILENVRGFVNIERGGPFKILIKKLESLGYHVYHSLYNTKDYGIPQNRERVYFICIRKDLQKKEFVKPRKNTMKDIDKFILNKDIAPNDNIANTIKKKLRNVTEGTYILSCDSFSIMKDICPTLTRSGCKYMFHSKYNRYLSPEECLLLQGFRKNFVNVVGDVQLCHQIGNSMSVNVLKLIIKEALSCL